MALFDEASPICRGKNLSWETVLLFFNNMPREAMPKAKFNTYVEARINAWTQTHSQIARQLAFYYEENGICYPRFTQKTTLQDLFAYMQNWATKYFIPNPYAPSLKGYIPTCIYSFIIKSIKEGQTDFDKILDSIFQVKLNSHDKVNVYLSYFTGLIIDNNHHVSINEKIGYVESDLHPQKDYATDAKKYFDYFTIPKEISFDIKQLYTKRKPLQQVFYGAPGTGKSHEVKKQTGELSNNGEERDLPNVFRTTFHPDTDYASFVGCYKPTMRKTGKKHQVDGKDVDDEEIIYEFVPQTFTDAYIYAYKNPIEPTYLVIEEINRGNCAQIFGDLFQLLDRKDGTSEYKIKADKDLAKYLNDELGKDADGIKEGKLCLPANLNILATMNTSDQSLFPMDSAFKRRWDWKYIPIDTRKEQWNIVVEGVKYSWSSFLEIVNNRIFKATTSEDKQLGFYFCKAENKEVWAEKFVSKVLFYLWNDVFKDYDEGDSIFKDADSKPMPFSEFFNPDGSINEMNVTKLLTALKVENLDVKQTATTENGQGE